MFDSFFDLGAGRTGTVFLSETNNGKFCVIKSIKKDYIFKNHELKHVLNEREVLNKLDNPFCVRLFAEFEDAQFAYFAMEFVAGGELKSILREWALLPPERVKFYMAEVFTALEHMHSNGIVFRHLCPENILVDEEGHVKLVDFGSAIRADYNPNGRLYTICCSAGYLSPEQLNSKFEGGYGMEVDWWMFGIVMYELLTGVTPFIEKSTDSKYEILIRILRHKLKFPNYFDMVARDLVGKVLNPVLEQRLTSEKDIRNHPYFASIKNWKDVRNRKLIPPYVPTIKSEGDSANFRITEGSAKHWKLGILENKAHLL